MEGEKRQLRDEIENALARISDPNVPNNMKLPEDLAIQWARDVAFAKVNLRLHMEHRQEIIKLVGDEVMGTEYLLELDDQIQEITDTIATYGRRIETLAAGESTVLSLDKVTSAPQGVVKRMRDDITALENEKIIIQRFHDRYWAMQTRYPQAQKLARLMEIRLGIREKEVRDIRKTINSILKRQHQVHSSGFEYASLIAAGGMGLVVSAYRLVAKRFVAIKIRLSGSSEEAKLRHEREVEIGGKLQHPHIVKMIAAGRETRDKIEIYFFGDKEPINIPGSRLIKDVLTAVHDEQKALHLDARKVTPEVLDTIRKNFCDVEGVLDFTVMALVRGPSLTDFVLKREALLTGWQIAEIGDQILGALKYANREHGIVHRDMKPDNVAVRGDEPENQPYTYLLDWGVARESCGDAKVDRTRKQLTNLGVAVGTPLYAAPEQLGNINLAVSEKTDIYAWALTMYFTLTGVNLFDTESANVIEWIKLRQNAVHIGSMIDAAVNSLIERTGITSQNKVDVAAHNDLKKILKQCLAFDSKNRPNFEDVEKAWGNFRRIAANREGITLNKEGQNPQRELMITR
ncbi:MAG: serine/threonine-protein kinase [Candidatus Margulisiibacteriota bacterium]